MEDNQIKEVAEKIHDFSYELIRETLKEIKDSDYVVEPLQIDKWQRFTSALYATLNDEMKNIEKQFPFAWRIIREKHKSDKQADLEYDSTLEGQKRIGLKYDLKTLEKLSSSLKKTMDRMNRKYYNSKQ